MNVNINLIKRICGCICGCKDRRYLSNIMDDSAITCDEDIESYDKKTSFNENKAICKGQDFYIMIEFLFITIVLLMAFNILRT